MNLGRDGRVGGARPDMHNEIAPRRVLTLP
jgi:hypothetical protein